MRNILAILVGVFLIPSYSIAKTFYFAVPSPNNATSGSTEYQLLAGNRDHMVSKVNNKIKAIGKYTHYVLPPGTHACKDAGKYKIWEGWYGDWSRLEDRYTEDQVDQKITNWKNNETFQVDIVDPDSGVTTETVTSGVTIKGNVIEGSVQDVMDATNWYWCTSTGEAQ